MKKILSIASLFVFCFSVLAQETQWLFSINNVVRSVSPVVCRNIDGNIVLSNSFTNTGSFQFKGATVTTTNLNTATTTNLMLSSVTPDSSLMWVFSTDVNTNQNIAPIDITTDEVGNIYLLLHYNGGSISFSSNIQLSYPSGYSGRRNALIKFDRNGNPLWAKEYGSTTLDPTDQVTHKMDYSGGRIYIYHTLRGIMEYTGSNQTCSATDSWNYGLAAYDSNGSFLWVKQYGSIVGSATARRDLKATLSSIYFTAYFDKEYIHNSDTLPKGYYLIQLDTAGRLANYIYIKYATRNISSYSGIKFDVDTFSGSVYMGLPFHDSIEILSHKEISKTNFTNPLSFCLLKLNKQMDSLVWCKCQDSLSQGFLSPVAGLLLDNNNLYLGGQLTGDSVYLSNTLFGTGLTAGSKLFIAKADTLGNLLWGFANGNLNVVTSINSMTVDTVGNLLLAGVFVGKVRIFNDSLANNNIAGSFLAKITDYSITRGEVLSGPYCAGDTFLVPYTKMGNYDTANYFIAELSDEKGNFEGGERELGQMKSTQDSTIIGRLPLFQVASSGNYRIRVRSTHPPVQSFYKLDSLRLLIYSRDKADPGPSETLCYGDSFQLHTYGGTAWEWSPAFRMDDSSSRTPWIYLEKDTVFRIVISDSSGCGEPDTAFKQIFIKSNPKIITDRLVNICNNTNITLSAQFKNGDSSAYKWTWYDTEQDFSWQELKSDSFAYFDSLNYIFKSKPVSTNIGLVLEDGCSIVKDTAFVLINLNSPLEVVSDLQDTTVCIGEKIHIRAFANGGDSLNYNFKWYFKDSLIGEKQSLEFTPSDYFILEDLQTSISNSLKVFVFDDCMGIDSFVAQITVRAKLEVSVLDEYQKSANDTSVCSGSELKFFANGTGGVEEDYEFTWLLDDEEISKGDSVEINSKDFKSPDAILTLILQDDCSILADTQRINLHTLPELKAEFSAPDTICLGEEISLAAQGSGGIENQYQFTWLHKKDDGTLEVLKNAETLDLNSKTLISESQYSQFNTREILLVLRDNCSSPNDTFSKKIIIRPELSLTLSSSTICADPNAILTANPKGGNPNSYSINWFDKNGNPLGSELTQNVSPEGFDKFSATLSDNCSSESATAEIKVDRVPDLLTLENTPSEGCQPLPVIFEPKTNYPDKYGFEINFGNNNSENVSEGTSRIDYTYKTAGTFTPSLKITTQNGCEKTIQGTPITIYPKPIADFSYEPEYPDMDNPLVQFKNQSHGAKSYIWTLGTYGDFTADNPEIKYQDSGYHYVRLIAISDKNCSDTTESQIYIKTNYRVFLPSAFSPNGDGLNDDFKPSVRGFSELDFRVYSRWGELIFHSTKDEAWDGTFNGEQMPDGVYAFTLSVINVFGEKQLFKGTVTLIR